MVSSSRVSLVSPMIGCSSRNHWYPRFSPRATTRAAKAEPSFSSIEPEWETINGGAACSAAAIISEAENVSGPERFVSMIGRGLVLPEKSGVMAVRLRL